MNARIDRTIIDANRLSARFRDLDRRVRYLLVGVGGLMIGFAVYNLIYWINPLKPRATTSWFISSIVGVWRQHALHRWLTFPDRRARYGASLRSAFLAYSLSIVVSTIINWWLTQVLGIHHLFAWLVAVGTSTLLNYFLLERFAFPELAQDDAATFPETRRNADESRGAQM